jgi:hypothetical protein
LLCNLNLTGTLESLDPNLAESIDKYLNRNIHLSCLINNQQMYLALAPRTNCLDINDKQYDCSYNIALLQPLKNNYSTFKLDQKLKSNPPIYRLTSQFQGTTPMMPRMSFNMLKSRSNKLCFDDGIDIEFNLETDNTGLYYIKYINDNTVYYIMSDSHNKCVQKSNNNFIRLGLTSNPKEALGFKLELEEDNVTEEFDPDNSNLSCNSCNSCNTDNLPKNIDTDNTNYSSLDTQGTNGDIQGFDEYENGSNYMPLL